MLRLATIALVIAVALLRGGSLRNFATLKVRWLPLVIIGFVIQLLIFTPFASAPLLMFGTRPLYVLSLALVVLWIAVNWRIPGMAVIAVGLALNVAVIAANGGNMPVSPEAARIAGWYEVLVAEDPGLSKHMMAPAGQAPLWLLGDVIPVPRGVPGASVLSIGDLVLTLGIAILCYRTLLPSPPAAPPGRLLTEPVDDSNGRERAGTES